MDLSKSERFCVLFVFPSTGTVQGELLDQSTGEPRLFDAREAAVAYMSKGGYDPNFYDVRKTEA